MDEQGKEHVLQFFTYAHLPPELQAISKPYCDLALKTMELPRNSERTKSLDALLTAKDSAVRAALFKT